MGPPKVVAIAVLLLLAALLMASLITSDIGLWIVWSRLGDEEFYMVVAVMLYHFLPQLQQSLVLVIAVLFSGSLNIALKYTLNLPRPPNPLYRGLRAELSERARTDIVIFLAKLLTHDEECNHRNHISDHGYRDILKPGFSEDTLCSRRGNWSPYRMCSRLCILRGPQSLL